MFAKERPARRIALVVTMVGLFSIGWLSFGWPIGSSSRVQMPLSNPKGWRRVFADDFNGTRLDSRKWGAYSGEPGNDPGGWWSPSHVIVSKGVVNLVSYRDPRFRNRWVSGGMSSANGLKQRYGKYLVRFRIGPGAGIGYAILLWPSNGHWPPEIDFAEDGGGTRRRTTATVHFGSHNSEVQRSLTADFTKWHTLGVEWTPGTLKYTIDGRVWATLKGTFVPSTRMELDAQTQAGTCGRSFAPCPNTSTPGLVDMQIDWVVAYRPA